MNPAHPTNPSISGTFEAFSLRTAHQPVGWAGFIKPNIGGKIEADVGQTMKLFTQPTNTGPICEGWVATINKY